MWEKIIKNRKLSELDDYALGELSFDEAEVLLSDLYDEVNENYEFRIRGEINRDGSDKRVTTSEHLSGDFVDSELSPKKINEVIKMVSNALFELKKIRDALI
jgi:hypothetical protein